MHDIAEYLDGARQYDGYVVSLCPFHQENRPSFFVYPDKYYCKSCGAWGYTENLYQKLSKLPAKPKVQSERFYNPWTYWIKRFGRLGLVLKSANQNIKRRPSIYLRDRGITDEIQVKLKLGYLDDWYTFPCFGRHGKIVGGVARRGEENPSPSKYVTPKGQKNTKLLYVPSWELIEQQRNIVLVYGIIDAISLYQCGVGAMSTLAGTSVDYTIFDKFRKRILIIPDRKEEAFAYTLAGKLGWRGHVMNVHWPDDCKDVNDVFCKHRDLLLSGLEVTK